MPLEIHSSDSHGESAAESSSDDANQMRDVKEVQCAAPCHHKCKIGVSCTRHGAKILAKLKRKAEKQRNSMLQEQQHQNGTSGMKKPQYAHGFYKTKSLDDNIVKPYL